MYSGYFLYSALYSRGRFSHRERAEASAAHRHDRALAADSKRAYLSCQFCLYGTRPLSVKRAALDFPGAWILAVLALALDERAICEDVMICMCVCRKLSLGALLIFLGTNLRTHAVACKAVHMMHAPCIHLNSSVHRPHAHRSSPIRPNALPHRIPRKTPFASRPPQQMLRSMYVLRLWRVKNSATVVSMRRCRWIARQGLVCIECCIESL
jgi:hypothetical protein